MKKLSPLLLIIIAAFLVRIIGLNFGLPFIYHDDEPIIVNYALAYGTGDFNPHLFKVSPFISYTLFFIYGLFFVIGYLLRYFHTVRDFAYLYFNNPAIFYIIARAVYGLICGTVSVWLLYLVGKRYFNRETGLLAALFLASNYLHVRDSHYAYFDIPLTLCILLFFIKADGLLRRPGLRANYIWLGILLALATAVKYSGALLLMPCTMVLLYSLYLQRGSTFSLKASNILLCGLAGAAAFFIFNPFALISFREFIGCISRMPFIEIPPHFHIRVSLFEGCGRLIVILGGLGLLWSLFTRRNRQILLVAYVLFYYWVISGASQPAERQILPIVPLVLLFGASIVVDAKSLIKKKAVSSTVAFAVVAILIFPSLTRIYYSDRLFLREDTRTSAYNWIKENIPKGSSIALDATASWFPRLKKSKEQLEESYRYFNKPQFKKPKGADQLKLKLMLDNPDYPEDRYYLFYLKEAPGTAFVSVHPDLKTDYSELKSHGVEYAVLSYTLVDEKYKQFVEDVEKKGELLKVFSPYRKGIDKIAPDEAYVPPAAAFMLGELKDRKSYGPVIKIYRLR